MVFLQLVDHFTHVGVPLTLPDNVDELSVLVSTPEDIAGAVAWLLDDVSGYVSGQAIRVDGGRGIG